MVAQMGRLALSPSHAALKTVAALWYGVALVGQCLFVYYLAVAYALPTLAGNAEEWNRTQPIVGHVAGDVAGNLMFVSHVLLAIIVALGGTAQLLPALRSRFPAFHRWNGRVFVATVVVMALGGLAMTWLRGAQMSLPGALGVSLNGVLMLAFSAIAVRHARHGQIAAHRRWALRTFMVANGVWFYRLGFMAWIILNQGPRGSTNNLDGPFDVSWAFLSFLLPLALVESYLQAQSTQSNPRRWLICGLLFGFTGLTALGIFGAFQFMWRPHL